MPSTTKFKANIDYMYETCIGPKKKNYEKL